MLGALRHRGPDDEEIYLSPRTDAALVHARLAILDSRSVGRQPMKRNGYCLTYNGELYNFRALREELVRAGESFSTETDTEVLLTLYLREGPGCLERLRGMFAFAVWNEKDGSCFLARDRFGIKPLYYSVLADGTLLFASEVKALLASGRVEHRIDSAGLESYLAFGSVAEPMTMIAEVRCVEGGHFLRWHGGNVEKECYSRLKFGPEKAAAGASGKEVRAALMDSVRHHFVSDVPVGIFLSGGLDSGALVALAKELGENVTTFSIGVEDLSQDESDAARRRAAFFGTDHREMLLTRELARDWLEAFLRALDQPTVDGFNTYCAAKLAHDHGYRVVLSGLGGDELFGGYPSFCRIPRLMLLGRALFPFRRITGSMVRAWEDGARSGRSSRLAAYLQGEPTLLRAYELVRSIFSPRERAKIISSLLDRNDMDAASGPIHLPHLPVGEANGISYLELTRYLRNQLLRDADVMSMAHGVELRVPFIDHQLFATVQSIPAAIRLAREKELLRKAVPELPKVPVPNSKRGFALPFDSWLDTTWRDLKENEPAVPAVPLDSWSRKWSLIVLRRWLARHGFGAEA